MERLLAPLGLTCVDALYIIPPLVAFGLGAAASKSVAWGKIRMKLPESVQAPLRNPLINGLVWALVALLVILGVNGLGGGTTPAFTESYASLLPPEMYGSGGLMPIAGSMATGGLKLNLIINIPLRNKERHDISVNDCKN